MALESESMAIGAEASGAKSLGVLKSCLTDEQRQNYIKLCLERGDAPLKPQFLIGEDTKSISYRPLRNILGLDDDAQSSVANQAAESADDLSASVVASNGDTNILTPEAMRPIDVSSDTKQRMRGQNKDRKGNLIAQREANNAQLCPIVSQTNSECQKGDKCQFVHDRHLFLKSRIKDLGEACSNFENYGMCRYGINCRFGSSHIQDGFNITKDGIVVTPEILKTYLPHFKAINEFDIDVKTSLRRRTYSRTPKRQKVHEKEIRNNPLISVASSCGPEMNDGDHGDQIGGGGDVLVSDKKDKEAEKLKKRNEIFCSGKRMLAPLTTVGNLPFRRLCVSLGAEVTMSEMAMARSILDGASAEMTLLKRHPTEKWFGVQLACGHPETLSKCCHFINEHVSCDFIDLNSACPLEPLHKKMCGSVLMDRPNLLQTLSATMKTASPDHLISVKMRMGHHDNWSAHKLIPRLEENGGVDAIIIHGRTSRQRYTKTANWDYLAQCKSLCTSSAFIGNGDVMSWDEYQQRLMETKVDNILIGRGALIKPWIFTELEEQRLWDISGTERFDLMKKFVSHGFDHWGTDSKGIEITRRYFLEFCSFLHRYIPIGLLERTPQKMSWRSPHFVGRNDLETKLGSTNVNEWINLSKMLIGPTPDGFTFVPKHKANSSLNS